MPGTVSGPRTLYDKVFASHIVDEQPDGTILLYIDRHLVHEVTSPQAFEGLRNAGRKVRRPDCTLATTDHNVPTTPRKNFKSVSQFVEEDESRLQCETLEENVKAFKLTYFGLGDKRQGIVHIIGPEQGFTLPGTTEVSGIAVAECYSPLPTPQLSWMTRTALHAAHRMSSKNQLYTKQQLPLRPRMACHIDSRTHQR